MMFEARLSVLLSLRQGDPGLDAEQAVRRLAGGGARSLGVGDPAPATIQLTAPGRMIWFEPRLSRCWNSPRKR
jgi:hypothetical protein